MAELKIEPFEKVVTDFENFLKQQGAPSSIRWIAPEHTLYAGNKRWFIFKDSQAPSADVQSRYYHARETGLGVRFKQVCKDQYYSYCCLIYPANETDASYKLLLNPAKKLTIPVTMHEAQTIIKGSLRAIWYNWRLKRYQQDKLTYFGLPNPDTGQDS